MVMMIATTIGIACTCVCWVYLHRREEKKHMESRTAVAHGLAFPYPIDSLSSFKHHHNEAITLDDTQGDKLAKDLFVAGYRTGKTIRIFRMASHVAWILPVTLTIYSYLVGNPDIVYLGRLIGVGVGIFWGSRMLLKSLKQKRQNRILKHLPQFIDLMIVCIEAGLNFTAALPRVIKEMDRKEALVKEFELMHQEYLSGLPFSEALDRLSKRCEVTDLSVVLNSISQSEQMGTSLGHALRVQAVQLRDKNRQRMREKAQEIPVKIAFPALLILSMIFIVALMPSLYQISIQFEKIGYTKAAK